MKFTTALISLTSIACVSASRTTSPEYRISWATLDQTVMRAEPATPDTTIAQGAATPITFSNVHSDGMVLQAAPKQAMIWGFCAPGAAVTVGFRGANIAATVEVDARAPAAKQTTWRALLPATPVSFGNDTISVTDGHTSALITGVMWGDVWICSGQSNMAYPLGKPNCWNNSNTNCTARPEPAMCEYGCANHSQAESRT